MIASLQRGMDRLETVHHSQQNGMIAIESVEHAIRFGLLYKEANTTVIIGISHHPDDPPLPWIWPASSIQVWPLL